MSVIRKDPVFSFIQALSEDERNALIAYFRFRRFAKKTVTLLKEYFSLAAALGPDCEDVFSEVGSSVEKFRIKEGIIDFLRSSYYQKQDPASIALKDSMAFERMNDFESSLDHCVNGLTYVIRREDFGAFVPLWDQLNHILPRVEKNSTSYLKYEGIRFPIRDFIEGYSSWLELHKLWEDFGAPFVEARIVDSKMRLDLVESLNRKLAFVTIPVATKRTMVYYFHVLGFIKLAQSDYVGLGNTNQKIFDLIEQNEFLKPYFEGLLPQKMLQSLVAFSELKQRNPAFVELNRLEIGIKKGGFEYHWRLVLGKLLFAEYFQDGAKSREAEMEWWLNLEEFESKLPGNQQINIWFHLLRNKIFFCQYKNINALYQKLNSFNRNEIKKEYLIYTRIFEIIQAWDYGQFENIKRLVKNCKLMMSRAGDMGKFPQAELILDFFAHLRSNMLPMSISIRIETTRMELARIKSSLGPEGRILDFDFILSQKDIRSEILKNGYAS